MRHKYSTRSIVLARTSLGEANGLVTLLTEELGLVRARAQGIRRPGAKLAAALVTYAESEVTLVRGKEGWRVTGATLAVPWFSRLAALEPRRRAARITGLVLRLVGGDSAEPAIFPIVTHFFEALCSREPGEHDAAECLAALSLLAALGLDAGQVPDPTFDTTALTALAARRGEYVMRINRGIAASGL